MNPMILLKSRLHVFSILVILLTVQCTKDIEQNKIPYNNPTGEYSYSSSKTNYSLDDKALHTQYSEGMMDVNLNNNEIEFIINPKVGFSFKINARDTVSIGIPYNHYFFNIKKQMIEINDVSFELVGTHEYVSGDTLFCDGQLYSNYKSGSIKYKSTNTNDGNYVITYLSFGKAN